MWARASPIIFEVFVLVLWTLLFTKLKINNTNTQDRTPLKLLSIYLLAKSEVIFFKNNGQKEVIKSKL